MVKEKSVVISTIFRSQWHSAGFNAGEDFTGEISEVHADDYVPVKRMVENLMFQERIDPEEYDFDENEVLDENKPGVAERIPEDADLAEVGDYMRAAQERFDSDVQHNKKVGEMLRRGRQIDRQGVNAPDVKNQEIKPDNIGLNPEKK